MSSPVEKRKRKAQWYKSAGRKHNQSEQAIKGPGIFITCTRGKEPRAVGEAYDLLNEVADRIYPDVATSASKGIQGEDEDVDEEMGEDDIETLIQNEISELKKGRDKGGQRFQSRKTGTDCLLFISCAKPYDPVLLVEAAISDLLSSKRPKTRFLQRLSPVSQTCSTSNLDDIEAFARKILAPIFTPVAGTSPLSITYKIEMSVRLNNSVKRSLLLPLLGGVVQFLVRSPAEDAVTGETTVEHTVRADMTAPQHVVLVEVYKNICGMSVVNGELYELQSKRFNLEAMGLQIVSSSLADQDTPQTTIEP